MDASSISIRRVPEKATHIHYGNPIPIRFIGTDLVQKSFEGEVFQQAYRVSRLPHISALAFMPDSHIGLGTCIGTMAAWPLDKALVSASIVGVDIGCGMRLVLTPLRAEDLSDKAKLRELMVEVESRIPMGAGKKVESPVLDDEVLEAAILGEMDAAFEALSAKNGVGRSVPGSVLRKVDKKAISDRAWTRGQNTLGTLGGGNHFIEVQIVHIEPGMEGLAKEWGLVENQVVIEIHSGSRGFGHQIAEEYIRLFRNDMERRGVEFLDRNLVHVPLDSELGNRYIAAHNGACNFSVLNRFIMSYHVHRALGKVFKLPPGSVSDLSDIIHNYATVEDERYLVHRKGATAAYPAKHGKLEDGPFFDTGFPALVPGSMGTASFIMQALPEAEETHYTVNHGAGRTMSRRQAKASITLKRFQQQMSNILVNEKLLDNIKDEAPDAYKDIDEITKSVQMAGLARPVARCVPVAVMKGSDIEFRRRR